MEKTNCVTHLAVFSFETVSVWKSSTKLTLSNRLKGPLRLISLALWASDQTSIFCLPKIKIYLPQAIEPAFFPALHTP